MKSLEDRLLANWSVPVGPATIAHITIIGKVEALQPADMKALIEYLAIMHGQLERRDNINLNR